MRTFLGPIAPSRNPRSRARASRHGDEAPVGRVLVLRGRPLGQRPVLRGRGHALYLNERRSSQPEMRRPQGWLRFPRSPLLVRPVQARVSPYYRATAVRSPREVMSFIRSPCASATPACRGGRRERLRAAPPPRQLRRAPSAAGG